MKKIGILSDTHGWFDDTLRRFFSDVDELWHAGDIGSIELADQIAAFKPLRAVWGNIDGGATRLSFHRFESFECERVPVLMTHIGGYPGRYDREAYIRILQERPKLFICGHSHILKIQFDSRMSMLCLNPGAAGINGFHQVRTAVRLVIEDGGMHDLEVGEWPRR